MKSADNRTQPKETDALPPNITFYLNDFYPLYSEGSETWNRYMLSHVIPRIATIPDAMKDLAPLSAIERVALEARIGNLPAWGSVIGLSDTDFDDDIDFSGFYFPDHVVFNNSAFHGEATFDKAIFVKQANFSECTFHKGASFENALFNGSLVFHDIRALSAISFRHATIHKCLFSIWSKSCLGDVDFAGARFMEQAGFEDVIFQGKANFNNVHFTDRTSFERASFADVPTFHNALIHPDTTFHLASFPKRKPDVRRADSEERAWRTLKQAMNKVNNQESELRFFCREMSARIYRLRDEGRVAESLCLMLYRVASVYGTSFLRPVIALGIMTMLFAIYYTAEIVFVLGVGAVGQVFPGALRLSASTALNPTNLKISFDLLSTMAGQTANVAQWYIALSVQVFLSTVVLFLLALSIKNHFSMK